MRNFRGSKPLIIQRTIPGIHPTSVQFKGEINDALPRKRHQKRHLEFCTTHLLCRGSAVRVSPGAPLSKQRSHFNHASPKLTQHNENLMLGAVVVEWNIRRAGQHLAVQFGQGNPTRNADGFSTVIL